MCLQGCWCLDAVSVTAVPGVAAGDTRMAGTSTVFRIAWAESTTMVGEGGRYAGSWGHGCLSHVWGCWVMDATTVGGGARVPGATIAGRMGSQVSLLLLLPLPVPCGSVCSCSQEAGVTCTTSLVATGFSWASGLAAVAGRPGFRAPPLRFPWFSLFCVFSSPTFPYTDVWNSPMSWCVGQRNFLLSYRCFTGGRLKRRDRECLASPWCCCHSQEPLS